jgi:hypothetical protein
MPAFMSVTQTAAGHYTRHLEEHPISRRRKGL